MTEISLVKVTCPDCRHSFDVPDGAPEAQCPQCGAGIVWRSCLDTGEVFTVLRKWETWIHPNCNIRHVVDLSQVITTEAPAPAVEEPAAEETVYSPTQLDEDVDWPDQEISGRLIVDSDRLAILPGAGVLRPPLSVAWLRDVLDYSVHRSEADDGKKRKRFGRGAKKDGETSRPTLLLLSVPGGQISLLASAEPDVLLSQLDLFLRPRLGATPVAPPAAPPVQPPPVQPAPLPQAPVQQSLVQTAPAQSVPVQQAPAPQAPPVEVAAAPVELPDLQPDTPEGIYESIRKLAELAVVGSISSEQFADMKAQLLARL